MKSLWILILLQWMYSCPIECGQPQCGPGFTSQGYTYPHGDITLREGEDLHITCILNEAAIKTYGPNASDDMTFLLKDSTLPREIVKKVNSSAIELYIRNHTRTNRTDYLCTIKNDLVCNNVVIVGGAPGNVTDFDCVGENYEYFTCSWIPPNNNVHTDYTLQYVPADRPPSYYYDCPKKIRLTDGKMSCTWGLTTAPLYRHAHDTFQLNLTANNTFGTKSWIHRVSQLTKVRPKQPEKIVGIAISPHAIQLNWTVPMYMQTFPLALEYRVSWCTEHNKTWTSEVYKMSKQPKAITHTLGNLPFAHTLYDIRVAIKVVLAKEERFWSQNASVNVRTLKKLPDCPPNTTKGSYEILDGTETRRIFWQSIHYYQENDDKSTYHIEVEQDPDIKPTKITRNYAEFEKLRDEDYTFKIWSKNSVGRSTNYSIIEIPSYRTALKPLANMVRFDTGNGSYRVEWTESDDPKVVNYTLFWCPSQKDRPYPCDGNLQWEFVPLKARNKSLQLPTLNSATNQPINIYQFAISANSLSSSSGMTWAHCTIIQGIGIKMNDLYIKSAGSRFILIHWKLPCVPGDIQAFNVSHCIVDKSRMGKLVECLINTTEYVLFPKLTSSFGVEGDLNITNLSPYVNYILRVKPIIQGAESQFSESLTNSTLEDIPSDPLNLMILNVTDRSVQVQWDKPLVENGHVGQYRIFINNTQSPSALITAIDNQTTYTRQLINLLPRTVYDIKVEACGSLRDSLLCSHANIVTRTDVDVPATILKPSANWDNYTLLIKWEKPGESGIIVDYYQIIESTDDDLNAPPINTTSLIYETRVCHADKEKTVYIKVRGVNIKNNKPIYGKWSEMASFPCFQSQSFWSWITLVVFLTLIAIVAFSSLLLRKFCNRVCAMRNIEVKLPDGLDFTASPISGDIKGKGSNERHEEPLLGEPPGSDKLSAHPRISNGDSSGCCSATESVCSSVDSAGHLSMSDSGTDQPKSPSLSELEHKDVSLRQRPHVKKQDYMDMKENPQEFGTSGPLIPQTTAKSTLTPGYSFLGFHPPVKNESPADDCVPLKEMSKPLFDMPLNQELSSLSSKPGYVPYLSQEPAPKFTPYVVAGNPGLAQEQPKSPAKAPIFTDTHEPQTEDEPPGYFKPQSPTNATKLCAPWQPQEAPIEKGYVVVGVSGAPSDDLPSTKGSPRGYVPYNPTYDSGKKQD